MGRCADNTKKVFKVLWGIAGPGVLQGALNAVGHIELAAAEDPVFWTNSAKRTALASQIKADAKVADPKTAIGTLEANLIAEAAVYLRKKQGILDVGDGHPLDSDHDGIPDVADPEPFIPTPGGPTSTPPLPGGGA